MSHKPGEWQLATQHRRHQGPGDVGLLSDANGQRRASPETGAVRPANGRTAIFLSGAPLSKERPRFNPATGRVHTPRATRSAEHTIGLAYIAAGGRMIDGAVRVSIAVTIPRPGYHVKASGGLTRRGEQHPKPHRVRTPDIDNVTKAVLDGLNGVAYRDDVAVTTIIVTRRWAASHAHVGMRITIEPDIDA